jgi:hypothetical protein
MNMNRANFVSKTILVKFSGETRPNPVPLTLEGFDESGIYFQRASLAKEFLGAQIWPDTGNNPHIFVPLSQIEWMMLADTVAH